jgi:hypothetical protein
MPERACPSNLLVVLEYGENRRRLSLLMRCPSGDPLYALTRTKPVVLAVPVTIGSVGK